MVFLKILIKNVTFIDIFIWIVAFINGFIFREILREANTIYKHFNSSDRIVNLHDEAKRALEKNAGKERRKLTAEELLDKRAKTNKWYAIYLNLTASFPLMGMLGTVISLIEITNLINETATESFLAALTSTFWGIVAALVFKWLDAKVSYKIEDNEKHMDFILNPNRKN